MSKLTKTKTAFAVLVFLLFSLFPRALFAEDIDTKKSRVVTDIRKGQSAPYTGILLTTLLAAEIKENCSKDVIEKRIQIEVEGATKLANSACEEKMQVETGKREAAKEKYETIISAKDKEIENLRAVITPPMWYENPYFLFTVGFVAGTGLTLFAVKKF